MADDNGNSVGTVKLGAVLKQLVEYWPKPKPPEFELTLEDEPDGPDSEFELSLDDPNPAVNNSGEDERDVNDEEFELTPDEEELELDSADEDLGTNIPDLTSYLLFEVEDGKFLMEVPDASREEVIRKINKALNDFPTDEYEQQGEPEVKECKDESTSKKYVEVNRFIKDQLVAWNEVSEKQVIDKDKIKSVLNLRQQLKDQEWSELPGSNIDNKTFSIILPNCPPEQIINRNRRVAEGMEILGLMPEKESVWQDRPGVFSIRVARDNLEILENMGIVGENKVKMAEAPRPEREVAVIPTTPAPALPEAPSPAESMPVPQSEAKANPENNSALRSALKGMRWVETKPGIDSGKFSAQLPLNKNGTVDEDKRSIILKGLGLHPNKTLAETQFVSVNSYTESGTNMAKLLTEGLVIPGEITNHKKFINKLESQVLNGKGWAETEKGSGKFAIKLPDSLEGKRSVINGLKQVLGIDFLLSNEKLNKKTRILISGEQLERLQKNEMPVTPEQKAEKALKEGEWLLQRDGDFYMRLPGNREERTAIVEKIAATLGTTLSETKDKGRHYILVNREQINSLKQAQLVDNNNIFEFKFAPLPPREPDELTEASQQNFRNRPVTTHTKPLFTITTYRKDEREESGLFEKEFGALLDYRVLGAVCARFCSCAFNCRRASPIACIIVAASSG